MPNYQQSLARRQRLKKYVPAVLVFPSRYMVQREGQKLAQRLLSSASAALSPFPPRLVSSVTVLVVAGVTAIAASRGLSTLAGAFKLADYRTTR